MLALWDDYPAVLLLLFVALVIWLFYIGNFVAEIVRWHRTYKSTGSRASRNGLTAAWFTLIIYIIAGAFVIWCVFWPHPY